MVVLVVGIGPTVLGPPYFKQAGLLRWVPQVVCVVRLPYKSLFFLYVVARSCGCWTFRLNGDLDLSAVLLVVASYGRECGHVCSFFVSVCGMV